MLRPETRREYGGFGAERDDGDWQAVEQIDERGDGALAGAPRTNETFRESGRRHRETVALLTRLDECRPRCSVMGVVGVEEPDEDTGVQMCQSHSDRKPSSSPAA